MSRRTTYFSVVAVAGILLVGNVLFGDPPRVADSAKNHHRATAEAQPDGGAVLSVEAARERAKLIHSIYAATLEMMHHRYFHGARATVPARALEEVFSDIDRQSGIKSSWIAVNARAMSIDHEPKGAFELAAVKAIKGGADHFEQVDGDALRRVGAIRLGGGCMNCHGGFGSNSTTKKFAGLVIQIPLRPTGGKSD